MNPADMRPRPGVLLAIYFFRKIHAFGSLIKFTDDFGRNAFLPGRRCMKKFSLRFTLVGSHFDLLDFFVTSGEEALQSKLVLSLVY